MIGVACRPGNHVGVMIGACGAVSDLSNKIEKDGTWAKLAGFLLVLLLAYTWAQPFREIYGLEARNALMAREMLEDGLSLIPKALGRPYPDYPPLYFWLETVFSMPLGHVTPLSAVLPSAILLFGENNFAVRLPSAIAVGLSALLIYVLVFRLYRNKNEENRLTAILAALTFLACFEVFGVGFANYICKKDII